MKYIVTIEEVNTKDFAIEADSEESAFELAKEKYNSGDFVLDPGECQFRQMSIPESNNATVEWRAF